MNKPSKKLLDLALDITGERELEEFPKLLQLYCYALDMEVEIERLNNIIKELEEYMIGKDIYKILLYKLRDLKESEKE